MDVRQRVLAAALAVFALAAAPAAAAPGDLDPSFSNDGRVSTLDEPGHVRGARGRRAAGRADRRRGLLVRHRDLRPDGRLVVPARALHRRRRARHRLRRRRDGHDRDRGRAARRPTTCSLRPDGRIVAGGVASMDALDPGSFALAGYLPDGRLDPRVRRGRPRADARGRGLRRHLRPAWRAGATAWSRSGRPRTTGATTSRSRASTERGAPDPSFDSGGSLIVPTSAPYAYAAGGTLLPDGRDRRGRRLGPVLGRREPPLQRRAGRLQRRRRAPPWLRPIGALVLVRQRRRRAPRRARALGRRGDRAQRPPGHGARAHEPGGRARHRRGTATAPRSSAPATARWRPTSCSSPTAARSPPGTRATAPGTPSCSPASTPPGRWTAASAARAWCSPTSRARRSRAPPRWRASPTASSSRRASPAPSGSGPQCGGGTARLALARYQGGDAAAPARRRTAARAGHRRLPRRSAVRVAARAPDRPPRPREGARALPPGHALPRQAQPAAAADERSPRCCSARARSRSAAGARRRSP